MRIIILSLEYPPRRAGRLSEQLKAFSTQLTVNKADVNIITHGDVPGQAFDATNVKIIRVSNPVQTSIGFLTWVLTLNPEIERAAANVYYDAARQIDIMAVYDWHFVPTAVAMKEGLGIPFIYFVDSLEDQRSNYSNMPYNMAIKSIEWLGFYEASLISVKSDPMRDDIIRIYKVPKAKIRVSNEEELLVILEDAVS